MKKTSIAFLLVFLLMAGSLCTFGWVDSFTTPLGSRVTYNKTDGGTYASSKYQAANSTLGGYVSLEAKDSRGTLIFRLFDQTVGGTAFTEIPSSNAVPITSYHSYTEHIVTK